MGGPSNTVAIPSLPHGSPIEPPSPSTMALLALTQDITALISLSLEATASLVHDWFRSTLGIVGISQAGAAASRSRGIAKSGGQGEAGRGKAVVVVGANEATGQSLTLHLARSGYTVFPLLPLPSQSSPPASSALSSLLLTWSGIQKRLKARHPHHSGTVVPVITDPETFLAAAGEEWSQSHIDNLKQRGRFSHAAETVRLYCRDNNLALVAVVCASRNAKKVRPFTSPEGTVRVIPPSPSPPTFPDDLPVVLRTPSLQLALPSRLPSSALAVTDEQTLLSLYRTNVVDPLSVIKELSDLLAVGNGRVVFVNGGQGNGAGGVEEEAGEDAMMGMPGAMRMIGAARAEAARLLRAELGGLGIDVCEVVVGPMSPRLGSIGRHLRHSSEDSNETDSSRKKMIEDVLANAAGQQQYATSGNMQSQSREAILSSRLALLSRIFAVDDALLYSSVRRAIEDRYPRYRHHAGLTPLISSLVDVIPGARMGKVLGRWVVGRLLMPRSGG